MILLLSERWLSGRRRSIRNRKYLDRYRRFKSCSLRHLELEKYPRGRRGRFAKPLVGATPARVRISPSPPHVERPSQEGISLFWEGYFQGDCRHYGSPCRREQKSKIFTWDRFRQEHSLYTKGIPHCAWQINGFRLQDHAGPSDWDAGSASLLPTGR